MSGVEELKEKYVMNRARLREKGGTTEVKLKTISLKVSSVFQRQNLESRKCIYFYMYV